MPFDGPGAEEELLRDRAVGAPFGDERQDVSLAIRQLVELRAPVPADQALHDLGVEGGSSRGDALDRVDELGDVPHPVLEQVPDARRVVPDELEQVGRLEVLREDEDGDVRERVDPIGS